MKLRDLLDMLIFKYPRPAPGPTALAFAELHAALIQFWLAMAHSVKLDHLAKYLAARLEGATAVVVPQGDRLEATPPAAPQEEPTP